MEKVRIAVPSALPGGLEAEVGAHFGHCDLYTIIDVENGTVSQVSTLPNVPHEQGGCMAPVNHLASNLADNLELFDLSKADGDLDGHHRFPDAPGAGWTLFVNYPAGASTPEHAAELERSTAALVAGVGFPTRLLHAYAPDEDRR